MKQNKCLKSWASRNPDTLRFAVISDVHVQDTSFTLDTALDAFNEIGNYDALLMLGDIVYQDGFEPEPEKYDIIMNRIKEKTHGVPFVYTIGNHEFPILAFGENINSSMELFERKTNQPVKYHTKICGYHFITDVSVIEPDIDWIEEKVKEARADDANKPIFVMLHDGFQNMLLHSREYKKEWSFRLQDILREYPQVIALVGHIHTTAQSPDIIAQDGFTVVQVPCLGEIGYIQGDGLFEEFFIPGPPQVMMIEIENNIVYVYKLNLEDKEYIGEPYVIDIPKLINGTMQYTDKRRTASNIPYFTEDARVEINKRYNGGVEICFPKAYNEPMSEFTQDGFVVAYKAEVFDKAECVFSEIVVSDFYNVNNTDDISERFYKKITGLEALKEYEAVITPISPFRKEGLPIKKEFKIGE